MLSRDSTYRNYKCTKTPKLLAIFKNQRNLAKNKLQKARSEYIKNKLIISATKGSTSFWRELGRLNLLPKKKASALDFFLPNQLLNYYKDTCSVHPPCTQSFFLKILEIHPEFQSSFIIKIFDPLIRQNLEYKSQHEKGYSVDLPFSHLKNSTHIIASFIIMLYNRIICTSTYPDLWKTVLITPLNKCPRPLSVSDTRHSTLFHLRLHTYNIPISTKLSLAKSLVLPILDYNCLVFNDVSGFLEKKLKKILHSTLRYVYNIPRFSHVTPYKKQAKLLFSPYDVNFFS